METSFLSHYVKRVQIRSFFWSVFSCIRTRKTSVFWHFSRIGYWKQYAFIKSLFFYYQKPLLKFVGTKFWKKNIFLSVESISLIFLPEKALFPYIFFSETPANKSFFLRLVEIYFWVNPSFRLLEKDFLSRGDRLL